MVEIFVNKNALAYCTKAHDVSDDKILNEILNFM